MGKEQRTKLRRTSIYYLQTIDLDADAALGRVVDINETGLRLTGGQTIPAGLSFHVKVELPTTIHGQDWLELKIISVWTKTATNQDLHETGFQLENPTAEAREIIAVLDQEYVFSQ